MRLEPCLTALVMACLAIVPAHATCTVAATPLDFGNYSPFQGRPHDSAGQITVSCTDGENFVLSMNAGVHAGGAFSNRRLSNGDTYLSYQLYTDAARTTVWGDGTGGSATVSRSNPAPVRMYGRIPARQSVSAGAFSDTILLTVTY